MLETTSDENTGPLTADEAHALAMHVWHFNIGDWPFLTKGEAQRTHDLACAALEELPRPPLAAPGQRLGALPSAATWEPVVVMNEERDWEEHNREQRIRREAYEAAAHEHDFSRHRDTGSVYSEWLQRVRGDAARHYPLKKRVPKVIPDPHFPSGSTAAFRVCEARGNLHAAFEFLSAEPGWIPAHKAGLHWTHDRIRALAALLDDQWTWEDDTSVEGGAPT